MTDKQIVEQLGKDFDLLRRYKHIQDKELLAKGGANSSALNKFRGYKGNITVENLVKLLRGIGELERLEALLSVPDLYSPKRGAKVVPAKRIRTKANKNFKWKDEE